MADAHSKQVVEEFLTKATAVDAPFATAARLVEPVRKAFQEQKTPSDELPLLEAFGALVTAASNAPYTQEPCATHTAIIALLASIKASGVLIRDSDQTVCRHAGGVVWSDLPGLGLAVREAWNDSPPTSSAQQWESLNAFAARCTTAGVEDFSLFGIWALRDALETGWPTAEELDDLLPAAVAWIEIYGAGMVEHARNNHAFDKGGKHGNPARPGPLAKGEGVEESAYSVARWRFWLRRLEKLSADKDDNSGRVHTAKVAHRGLLKMQALDKLVDEAE